ncbi:MAG: CPBP family intramembrane metalloprotease, partial [Variibacter sp.]|nr:CPBP family intramembrane metalloprotease [Variibacter sp.]
METLFLGCLLALVFAFFARPVRHGVRAALHRRPHLVWLAAAVLAAIFLAAAAWRGAATPALALAICLYMAAPTLCAALQGPGPAGRPGALDFLSLLLFWLPLEFPGAVGAGIPRAAWGFLHSAAYGVAILLALVLFTGFRAFSGMKYRAPAGWRDLRLALAGFALVAPPLIAIGIPIGFIPPPHLPTASPGRMALVFCIIFVATALPEEILFRSLIQNLMMQRFGSTARTLVAASVVFGAAHLDNGPQHAPNWRYAILATVAGYAYGKVFQKSSTVLASSLLHALVDWTKH